MLARVERFMHPVGKGMDTWARNIDADTNSRTSERRGQRPALQELAEKPGLHTVEKSNPGSHPGCRINGLGSQNIFLEPGSSGTCL